MHNNAAGFAPTDFIDNNGRRVLTDYGRPGMDGQEGVGSTTQLALTSIASILFNDGPRLDKQQLEVIAGWVAMYQSR
jgi:hypothetical protein